MWCPLSNIFAYTWYPYAFSFGLANCLTFNMIVSNFIFEKSFRVGHWTKLEIVYSCDLIWEVQFSKQLVECLKFQFYDIVQFHPNQWSCESEHLTFIKPTHLHGIQSIQLFNRRFSIKASNRNNLKEWIISVILFVIHLIL